MRRIWLAQSLSAIALTLATLSAAHAETRVIITGEWPPYSGMQEPQGGSISAVVRGAFAAVGINTRVGFFSWYRMNDLLDENPDYVASFPHYYSAQRANHCNFSDPVGESPLGIAEARTAPLSWRSLDDLQRYRIGIVRTYVNSPELDERIRSGKIKTVAVNTDEDNLINLINGKVDAAVIDRNVYAYMLGHYSSLSGASQHIQLNPRVLVMQKMYVCFPRTTAGRALRDRFNRGLQTLQAPGPEATASRP